MKKFKRLLAFVLSVFMIVTAICPMKVSASETNFRKIVVGYFPSYRYSTVNSIDFSAMTHTMLSFLRYNDGFICDFTGDQIRAIKEKCDKSGTKLMIAVGGGSETSFTYSNNPISTAEKRAKFINDLMYYVDTYDLDGIDIDIEITNTDFWQYFDPLASELSERLKSEGKLFTIAVATWFADQIQPSTYDYFDFINLMCYDSMSNILNDVLFYKARGISDDKLIIGVPFYGFGANGSNPMYSQIIAGNKDELSQKDYYNGISYNGIPQITAKAEYSLSYGGIMIWEVGQDCFEPEYSLLQAIKKVYTAKDTGVTPVTDLTAKNTTLSGTTKLSWKASPDAVRYDIFNGPDFLGSTAGTSYSASGLTNGNVYTFKVFAVNKDGVSSLSTNVNVETPIDTSGISDWLPSRVYLKGDKAVYDGKVYMAQWWTQNNTPGSLEPNANAWTYIGRAEVTEPDIPADEFKITLTCNGDSVLVNTPLHFQATAEDGTAPYRYTYRILDDTANTVSMIKSHSKSGSLIWTPKTSGKKTICAEAWDSSGNVARDYISIYVRAD